MILRSQTFKGWLKANFTMSMLQDLAQYGAAGGFPGLTYYHDTVKLYRRYRDELWQFISDMAEGAGENTLTVLANGNPDYTNVANADQAENYIVWFVAEEYARQFIEEA